MDINLLKDKLIKQGLLNEIIFSEKLDSTNNHASKNNLNSDALVITSHQTDGSGRFGRQWKTSPGKNLTFTLVKNFNIGIDEVHLVNFYSSYILCLTLNSFFEANNNLEFELKWPNDILLNKKKIAGFLLNVKDLNKHTKKFIIGVGLNVNQNEFPEDISGKATSLSSETDSEINKEELLIKFIENFYGNLFLLDSKEELMSKWKLNSKLIGEKIKFRKVEDESEQEVEVINIENDGGLFVKFADGKKTKFYSGEISLQTVY